MPFVNTVVRSYVRHSRPATQASIIHHPFHHPIISPSTASTTIHTDTCTNTPTYALHSAGQYAILYINDRHLQPPCLLPVRYQLHCTIHSHYDSAPWACSESTLQCPRHTYLRVDTVPVYSTTVALTANMPRPGMQHPTSYPTSYPGDSESTLAQGACLAGLAGLTGVPISSPSGLVSGLYFGPFELFPQGFNRCTWYCKANLAACSSRRQASPDRDGPTEIPVVSFQLLPS